MEIGCDGVSHWSAKLKRNGVTQKTKKKARQGPGKILFFELKVCTKVIIVRFIIYFVIRIQIGCDGMSHWSTKLKRNGVTQKLCNPQKARFGQISKGSYSQVCSFFLIFKLKLLVHKNRSTLQWNPF